ncbi:MAG: putative exported protein [Holophagaceae bacterium]|nr:putative exported protein [Holophagaceae bacterium]
MRLREWQAGLLAFLFLGLPLSGGEGEAVGSLRTLQGPVFLVRGGVERTLTRPERLFEGDVLRTGAGGSLGLLLKDDTSISLGPGSRLSLDHFRFAPAQGRLGLVVRLVHGTMAFVSGLVAKLSPESVRVETPVATVGVRGTTFLVKAEEQ